LFLKTSFGEREEGRRRSLAHTSCWASFPPLSARRAALDAWWQSRKGSARKASQCDVRGGEVGERCGGGDGGVAGRLGKKWEASGKRSEHTMTGLNPLTRL
jgi:hypothetical protein